jgi:hypothetical protein
MAKTDRTLFVHVGPPKTGTSAVQHFLRGHDNSKVVYPKVGLWADGSHHNLVFNFYGAFERPEVIRSELNTLFAAVRDEACASHGNILISSEALLGRDVRPFIKALHDCLGKLILDTEILLTCREHFARASSLYNQSVKDFALFERQTPNVFLRTRARSLCYAPIIKNLRETGFPVRVLNYHPAEDFVPRFMQTIGFAPPEDVVNESRNTSLSMKAMISTLAANTISTTAEERATCFATLRKMRNFFAPSRFIFDRETVNLVEPLFREDQIYLSQTSSITLPMLTEEDKEDRFFLTDRDLEEIAAVIPSLGVIGEEILSFSKRHLKS